MSLKSFIENNNQKIITYLIIYLLVPAVLNTFTVMFSDKPVIDVLFPFVINKLNVMDNISVNVLSQFVTYIGMILFFIPTYIILYFLFKKIKKKNIIISLVSF